MSNTDLDPSIEALLNSANTYAPPSHDTNSFEKMLAEQEAANAPKKQSNGLIPEVDLSIREFKEIEKVFNDAPADWFDNPAYYKTAIAGEGNASQRLHAVLSKYLTCKDIKDRMVYRQQVIMAYWELIRSLAPKMADKNIDITKKMLVRFAVLLPSLFKPEQKELFAKSILDNNTNEPVLYLDEWFRAIATGLLKPSTTDEVRTPKKAATPEMAAAYEQQRLMQLQSKNSGKLQNAESLLNVKESERSMLEVELKSRIDALCDHQPAIGLDPHKQAYTEMQLKLFAEISNYLHALSKNNKELSKYLKELEESKEAVDSVSMKIDQGPQVVAASEEDISTEFETVRQMAKMTCGRQGNQFPVFTREFYHCLPQSTGFRENVIKILKWVESIDPGAFCRIHKQSSNRIVPYVILLPTYGDSGFCWEPFDRYNRVTSRGRIVVPMYPRDLKIAVLTAVADLRWQVAKEKASYYWMEEGLTGQYYEWIDKQKLKGDLKQYFIQDYVLWMTKESEGVQRLDKEVRGIFWRNMPFPQELKDTLKTRSLVYDELCKKDMNRAMSDGY
ncbi:MAG: hypothetical protein MJ169_06580 [Treponema sp.]|nr:hypothetical protein [Treponema sp.]